MSPSGKRAPVVQVEGGVTLGDAGVGAREPGVELDGLYEQAPGEPVGVLGALIEELPAAQIELIGVHVGGRRPGDRLRLARQQPDPQRCDDAAGDLVLDGEHVGEHTVVALGPQIPARGRVGQLRRDPDPVPGPADAALEDVAGTQPGTHLPRVRARALEGEGGLAGSHEEPGDLGEIGDEVVGDAVAEVFLVRIAAHVHERQHRHRGPLRLERVRGRAIPPTRPAPPTLTL